MRLVGNCEAQESNHTFHVRYYWPTWRRSSAEQDCSSRGGAFTSDAPGPEVVVDPTQAGQDFEVFSYTEVRILLYDSGFVNTSDNTTEITITPSPYAYVIGVSSGTGDGVYGAMAIPETVTVSAGAATFTVGSTYVHTIQIDVTSNAGHTPDSTSFNAIRRPSDAGGPYSCDNATAQVCTDYAGSGWNAANVNDLGCLTDYIWSSTESCATRNPSKTLNGTCIVNAGGILERHDRWYPGGAALPYCSDQADYCVNQAGLAADVTWSSLVCSSPPTGGPWSCDLYSSLRICHDYAGSAWDTGSAAADCGNTGGAFSAQRCTWMHGNDNVTGICRQSVGTTLEFETVFYVDGGLTCADQRAVCASPDVWESFVCPY